MTAYYNENNPFAAAWLQNLIDAGLIAHGYVDARSIADVRPDELRGFAQCHFFAGIGGWQLALRLAGWPDARPIWTGSCPCQPFSSAGAGAGTADARHLWPVFFELIKARRPRVVMGEQVASPLGRDWFAGVRDDLESIAYAVGAAIVPAGAVGAPHRRERIWFMGHADGDGLQARNPAAAPVGQWKTVDATGWRDGRGAMADAERAGLEGFAGHVAGAPGRPPAHGSRAARGFWADAECLQCADGKIRRIKSGLALLVDGLPRSVAGSLSGYGNAIVPQVAAEVIGAYMDCVPE